MDTIVEKFPELIDTGEYVQFGCELCNTKNGTTIHKDADLLVVVCGQCWHMKNI
jgi:transcription elongation factor Elf1